MRTSAFSSRAHSARLYYCLKKHVPLPVANLFGRHGPPSRLYVFLIARAFTLSRGNTCEYRGGGTHRKENRGSAVSKLLGKFPSFHGDRPRCVGNGSLVFRVLSARRVEIVIENRVSGSFPRGRATFRKKGR